MSGHLKLMPMPKFTFLQSFKKLTFFFLLSFSFSQAQVDLASWALTNDANPVNLVPEINADPMMRGLINASIDVAGLGVRAEGWTTANNLDINQFLQISFTPSVGESLFINNLIFTHTRIDRTIGGNRRGPRNYTIRYSLDINFSTFTDLVTNQLTDPNGKSENIPINLTLLDGQKIYIRFYGFDSQSTATGREWLINSNTLKITGSVQKCGNTTTWTSSSWNNGAPTLNNKVVINADYDTAANGSFEACELVINGGHTLTVSPNTTVKVKNGIDSKPTGYVIIEDSGSLVQVKDDAVNIGNITVKRNTTPVTRFDFTYWSSPVSGQTLLNTSPNTLGDKYFSYNTAIQNWKTEVNGSAAMTPGVGYLIRSPQSFSTTVASVFNATFVGSPNNGVINVNIPLNAATTGNFALIGNPYPSAVDADAFINANATVLNGALYFWTHNTPISNNIYNANDYAVYTLMGGVGTSGNPVPSGKIASGQGFFVDLNDGLGTSANLVFNNSMRVATANQNAQFFAANQSRAEVELPAATTAVSTQANSKSRLWLNLTNDQGAFSQTLIGYADAATNEYDRLLDGLFLDGFENVISFYSLLQDQWLSIQAKAMPFDNKDIIPLGYKSTIVGTFTISIADLDGLFGDQEVVLEDKLTGTTQLLKEADYTFTTGKGTFNDRFVISFPNKTLSTDDFVTNESAVQIFSTGNQLTIKSVNESILAVAVYDISGR
ncbi:MAG: hypothetical protein Q8J97_09910, partial [Flavobacteriaceae bacterium]|nr:hypothetical protein [Flavobacteriaceae bacterium]